MISIRTLVAALVVAASLVAGTPAPAAKGAVAVVVIEGRGHGHGVGLSQWGAEAMAREGRTVREILGVFYPGTHLARAGGDVRVVVHHAGAGGVTLAFPQGGEVRSAPSGAQQPGFPVRVGPGGRIRVVHEGGQHRAEALVTGQSAASTPTPYQADDRCALGVVCRDEPAPPPDEEPTQPEDPASPTRPPAPTPAPAPDREDPAPQSPAPGQPEPGPAPRPAEPAPPAAPGAPAADPPPAPSPSAASSAEPLWAVPAAGGTITVVERGRTYRGAMEAIGTGGGLRVLNRVDVETYLKGMAEVPGSWPAAAVEAQAIAARTYALRAMHASGEICDDQRCQVYVGVEGEHPGQSAAVEATRGQVLGHEGGLAAAVYSADGGGHSATTLEGFGTPDGVYPYLQAVRYRDGGEDPRAWRREVGLDAVASRLGYPGRIDRIRVAETGPSGRALQVELRGDAGVRSVEGRRFASALGLRSTLFTVELGTSDAAPDAPPPSELQAMPDEAAAAAAEPARDPGQPPGLVRARALNPDSTWAGTEAARTATSERLPLLPALLAAAAVTGLWWAALLQRPVLLARRGSGPERRATLRSWPTRLLRMKAVAAMVPRR